MHFDILLVEDDDLALRMLASVLEHAHYHVKSAVNGAMALESLSTHAFDLVITDLQIGEVDGITVMQTAHRQDQPPAVIVLTGTATLETSITALRSGAYDYLIKPCAPAELLQRTSRAITRRNMKIHQDNAMRTLVQGINQFQNLIGQAHPPGQSDYRVSSEIRPDRAQSGTSVAEQRYICLGQLNIDSFRRSVSFGGQLLHLTPIEYAMLTCLSRSPGHVLSYREIVRHTHGYDADDADAQVLLKAHVRNLRRKIAPDYLVNIRSTGYMLVPPDESDRN
jgi:DNA-binding response OmpR family regulator